MNPRVFNLCKGKAPPSKTAEVDIVGRGVERIFPGVSRERCMENYERIAREDRPDEEVRLVLPGVTGEEQAEELRRAVVELYRRGRKPPGGYGGIF